MKRRMIALAAMENWLHACDNRWLRRIGKNPAGRPKKRLIDNIEKDMKRAGLSLYGITTGQNRVRLEELVGDRVVNGCHCSIRGRTGLPNLTLQNQLETVNIFYYARRAFASYRQ